MHIAYDYHIKSNNVCVLHPIASCSIPGADGAMLLALNQQAFVKFRDLA